MTAIAAVLTASALLVLFRILLPEIRAPLLFLTLSVAVVSQYEGLPAGLMATPSAPPRRSSGSYTRPAQ